MSIIAKLLVATVAGYLYGYCFPPAALSGLAWFVFIPLFMVIRTSTVAGATAAAGLFSMAGMCATVDWLPRTIANYYGQPYAIGAVLFLGVMFTMVAPWHAAFGGVYRVAARRASALLPLYAGATWTAAEFARANLLTGNPWVLVGYSQIGVDSIVQIADVTGVYGIGFLIVAANAAGAELLLALRQRTSTRAAVAGGAIVVFLGVAIVAYGNTRLGQPAAARPATPLILVQGNVDLGSQWRTELYGENLELYLRLTSQALREEPVPLAIWPETAMTFFIDREPLYRAAIGQTLQHWDTQLVAGGPRHDDERPPRFFNSAFLLSPQGNITGTYDKEKLLPFAEYFPLVGADVLRRSFGRVREFTPGEPTPPLPTAAGPAGILICNEGMFPDVARRRVEAGAQYFINLTNDTWVGDHKFSEIMFNTTALRAVEFRRYVVRASTSGPSAIVDPLGRVISRTSLFEPATLRAAVRPRSDKTLYARFGDVFAWLSVGLCFFGAARGARAALPETRPAGC